MFPYWHRRVGSMVNRYAMSFGTDDQGHWSINMLIPIGTGGHGHWSIDFYVSLLAQMAWVNGQ